MGFSLSWIAVRGMPADAVLAQLKLERTGETTDDVPDAPISAAVLAGGWFLVIANDYEFADRAPLKQLSKTAEAVIACAVEEHINASGASAYRQGVETWSVTHDGERGLKHLDVRGQPPKDFESIRDHLTAKLSAAGGRSSEVDYLFDVPVEVAAALAGFRHDLSPDESLTFETLEQR